MNNTKSLAASDEKAYCEEKSSRKETTNNVLVAIDGNGDRVVIIPQIIFKGKRSISWKEVENYLIRYVEKIIEVSETEDLIYIDRLFVDEYTGSKYTNKLMGALPKVKANMSQGLCEMIEIATGKRWKEDFEKKHRKKQERVGFDIIRVLLCLLLVKMVKL